MTGGLAEALGGQRWEELSYEGPWRGRQSTCRGQSLSKAARALLGTPKCSLKRSKGTSAFALEADPLSSSAGGGAALFGHTTCTLGIHPFPQQGWRSCDHVVDSLVKV